MDSDEEEMAALRSSSRYSGSTRKPEPPAGDSSGDRHRDSSSEAPAATSSAASSAVAAAATSSAAGGGRHDEEEDAEPEFEAEAPLAEMMGFLPMSFGKKQVVRTTGLEVHRSTARNKGAASAASSDRKGGGGVQFGKRAVDAAGIVGASRRAGRAEEEKAKASSRAGGHESGPRPPPPRQQVGAEADSDDGGGGGAGEEAPHDVPLPGEEANALPTSHEVAIQAHEKVVTALGLDPKGTRMVTGGMDGVVKFYDFGGMSEEKNAFRAVEPVDGHMVQAICWSPSGGCLLVACSDAKARIYDRDGSSTLLQSTVKGDMYVRDMTHTKGHTQMITSGMWHPFHTEHWITSSLDGTIRIWDINATPVGMDQVLPSVHVLKTLDRRNVCVGGAAGRAGGLHPCCCTYSPGDAKLIAGGCSDGSVQVFFEKARYMKPDRILRTAHTAQVTDIAFVSEGTGAKLMVTRSLDDTMKVWDTRMLSDAKGPVKVWSDLPCGHEKSGLCTSPDGRYIATGTPLQKSAGGSATVRLWDVKDFSHVKTLDFGKKTPIRFTWPRELNQLIVGTSTGEVTMLYSPFSSKKGAMHFVGRRAKAKVSNELGTAGPGPIFNMTDAADIKKFYSTGHGNMQKIRRQEARQAQKTMTPIRPPEMESAAAQTSDNMAFAALVLKHGAKQLNLQNTSGQERDAQKALLAYADKTDKNPSLVDHAYARTQPEKLLDWSVDESEGDKRMSSTMKGDFCRKCGQKVCRCVDYSIWGQKKQRTS